MARRFAAVVSQAPGLRGTPSAFQRSSALTSASCRASSASMKSPTWLIRVASTRPCSSRNVFSICDSVVIPCSIVQTSDHSGRTSTEPYLAWGIFSAQRSASSRSLHSSKKKPPSCSCVSAKGPSVTNVFPSRTRTVVAFAIGESPVFDRSTPASFISFIRANQTVCPTASWSSGVSSTADSLAYINNMYFIRDISCRKGSWQIIDRSCRKVVHPQDDRQQDIHRQCQQDHFLVEPLTLEQTYDKY